MAANNNNTQTTNANSPQTANEFEGAKKQQQTPERQPERMQNATTPGQGSQSNEKDRFDTQKGGSPERSNSGSGSNADRSGQSGSGSETNSSQREGSKQSNVNR